MEEEKKINVYKYVSNLLKGTKLYSPLFGNVEFIEALAGEIIVKEIPKGDFIIDDYIRYAFNQFGEYLGVQGHPLLETIKEECMLFPSEDEKDWQTWAIRGLVKLEPFDKVLMRTSELTTWFPTFFSRYNGSYYINVAGESYKHCVPYNLWTAKLSGTREKPENY
jgi:hypothetical protein